MDAIARYLETLWDMPVKYRIVHDYQSCPRAAGGHNPEVITTAMRREAERIGQEIEALRQKIIKTQERMARAGI